MEHYEKTIGSEMIYRGRVVTLRKDIAQLEDGREATREVIEHPGGVCVVAVDENDNLLLVRQFRYPMGQALLELPAGKLEYGEDPFECGKRELEEETGCTAAVYHPLGQLFPTPAYDCEVIHIYYAKELSKTNQHLDDGEFLTVESVPFEKVVDMVLANEIRDAKTQIGVLKAKLLRDRGEI